MAKKKQSASQAKRARRDEQRRQMGELPVQAERKANERAQLPLVYPSGTIGVGPVEEPVRAESTAEVLAWVKEFNQAGIKVTKDVRLHK